MELKQAYKVVYDDIVHSGCGLFIGKYDRKNGNEKFMHGILTAMEFIASKVSEEEREKFSDMFLHNMEED